MNRNPRINPTKIVLNPHIRIQLKSFSQDSNPNMSVDAFVVTKSPPSSSFPVTVHQTTLPPPSRNEVLVRFHASSINPLDLEVISGAYPVKPIFSHNDESILGFDGIGEVVSTGLNVKALAIGDFVIPSRYGVGTWRSHAVVAEELLDRVPRPNDLLAGSILKLGLAPAYFLTENMATAPLRPGDWIAQNAGTGIVPQMVAQFARRRGVSVLSVVRDRDSQNLTRIAEAMTPTGTSAAVAETVVVSASDFSAAVPGKHIVLAIDSVCGLPGQQLLESLSPSGTYAQHGFLGGLGQVLPVDPVGTIWGRQLSIVASRTSSFVNKMSDRERRSLFGWFVQLFNTGAFELPKGPLAMQEVRLSVVGQISTQEAQDRIVEAVGKAKKGRLGQRKQVIVWS